MHEFTVIDLGGVVAVAWVVVKVLGPFAGALARRLEGRPAEPMVEDPAVPRLREELDQLQERVDFLERALASRESPRSLRD